MSLLGIGCYTAESDGRGTGITLADFDRASGQLTVLDSLALASPSWLVWHPSRPVLYAASEIDDGQVSAVLVEKGRLRLLASVATGGRQPCHLAISPDGRRLYAANYGSGSLAAFELAADGSIIARTDLAAHSGHGPDEDRQAGPHVHMVVLDELAEPAGELISAVDLGIDQVVSYRLDNGLLSAIAVTSLPAGCGPRQLVRSAMPGRAYLVAELSGQLLTLDELGPGSFEVVATTPASEQPIRNLPAQFSLSADGRLGYL
ncbi:MAG: beta-propeller fold lactonase family protein, partial [Jatrophihabitantaceae bacterium]